MSTAAFLTKEQFLNNWQGHRTLTRKTIEKFPEKELFEFSIGGMRTFSDLIKELLSIGLPGLEDIVNNNISKYNHNLPFNTKEALLAEWDRQTPLISEYFNKISEDRMKEDFNLFGEFNFPINQNMVYFLDNEIHHRAQGYVYLRSLGIEPPMFWDRY
ncbi:DinB family protein [Sphingobacterium daejeonense]|uniref:DinB family protein n=1 Tax=Sphingobacterium daejeonense TaxID=371142 RepID=A0ABW3RPM9_9SPHI